MKTYNNIKYVQETIKRMLKTPKTIVDATCGNGNDTFYLASKYPDGKVYAFDIQKLAIENTQNRCKALSNIEYINDSHTNITKYVKDEIDLVIFNLGYLPNQDKEIVTTFETTKIAVESSLVRLRKSGIIILTLYKGVENIVETLALKEYLRTINKDEFIVSNYHLYNLNDAPENIIIEKK